MSTDGRTQNLTPESSAIGAVETVYDILYQAAERQRAVASTLTVESDETHTIEDGETQSYQTIQNEGTILNAGTLQATDALEVFSTEIPDIEKLWNTTPKSAFNKQQPTVYIYTTLDPDFEDFDAEGSARIENHQVEIDVFTFDESLTMTITREVKSLLEEYMRDNYAKTRYQYIKPELTQDNRNVNNPRNTEPYWAKVQAELMAKRTPGL